MSATSSRFGGGREASPIVRTPTRGTSATAGSRSASTISAPAMRTCSRHSEMGRQRGQGAVPRRLGGARRRASGHLRKRPPQRGRDSGAHLSPARERVRRDGSRSCAPRGARTLLSLRRSRRQSLRRRSTGVGFVDNGKKRQPGLRDVGGGGAHARRRAVGLRRGARRVCDDELLHDELHAPWPYR